MSRQSGQKPDQTYPALWERSLIAPLQFITNYLATRFQARPSNPGRSAISLGRSPNLFRPRDIEEIFLEINRLVRSLYVVGQSGSGKTSLILLLIMNLIQIGMGFVVIDLHGDLSQMILNYIASTCRSAADFARISSRLVWIEPFNSIYAPGINLLYAQTRELAYAEAIEMLAIFKRLWKDVAWGARMEEVTKNVLLTLSLTGRPLIEAPLLLTNEQFRASVVSSLTDPDLLFYWNQRFASFSERMRPIVTEPVANRLSILTEGPLMRHLATQRESLVHFRTILDDQQWCIINLSKGILSQNAHVLGSTFTAKIKSAAMSRANIKEEERVLSPFFIDEFQNFSGDNYEEILSEARKYRLALILAHQNLAQLEPSMRATIFGNVGSMMLFRLGHHDIREFAQEFNPASQGLVKQTLSTLQVGEAVKREDDGNFRKIQIHRIPQFTADEAVVEKLRQSCYDRYYRRRSEIDAELSRTRAINPKSSVVIYDNPNRSGRSRRSPSDELPDEVS